MSEHEVKLAGIVKPLEWRQLTSPRDDGPPEPIAEWEADCIIGTYIIKDDGGEWWLHLADLFDTRQVSRSDDPDILRTVAHADFADRILSQITLPDAPVAGRGEIREWEVLCGDGTWMLVTDRDGKQFHVDEHERAGLPPPVFRPLYASPTPPETQAVEVGK